MKRNLGPLETLLFAFVQMRALRALRTGDLTGPLKMSAKQERELFSRMARGRLIAKVRRGLYLVPPRLPLGGRWSPDEIEALAALMADCGGRYQICGPNTFNRYGFSGQIPNRVYAYNNRLSGDRKIGAVELTLIKVADERLGGTEDVRTPEGLTAVYSSRPRALMDAVYDWSRFAGMPRAFEWIRREIGQKRVRPPELADVTIKYGNQGTARRIGALLESEGVSGTVLKRLERILRPTTSLIPWIPGRPKRGKVDTRWGVILNEAK